MPRSRSTASRATRPRAAEPSGEPTAVRIVETVGSSTRGWDAAVIDAVKRAKDDAPQPIAAEVVRLWVDLGARARATLYRADVKVAYRQPLVAPARAARPRKTARA